MTDKILVVDDEADILNLAKTILEEKEFQVVTASDGEEALRKAEAEVPDLVLLDLLMPIKTGLEVCKVMKDHAKTRHIPVVIFTVHGRDIDRRKATEAGCDGYITKPFTSEVLIAEVKQHLEKARRARREKTL